MDQESSSRVWFVLAACLLCIPWLAPCGVTIIPATALMGTRRVLFGNNDVFYEHTDRDLIYRPVKPGASLIIRQHQPIPRHLLVSAQYLQGFTLAGGRESIPWPRPPGSALKRGAADTLDGFAKALMWIDPLSHTEDDHEYVGGSTRKQVILSTAPLVVLQGDVISFARHKKGDPPYMALASTLTMLANASVTTSDGTIFAMAQRIHFRGPSSEIVLEGSPTIQFGHQQIKASRLDALMRLNFATRTVTVSSRAIETKF